MLRLFRKVLMRILLISPSSSNFVATSEDDDLPEDVKEGHFVVHTFNDGKLKRFIIELDYLAHPGFLKLLKLAEEEFGFQQEGVLVIPCGPNELQRILENRKDWM